MYSLFKILYLICKKTIVFIFSLLWFIMSKSFESITTCVKTNSKFSNISKIIGHTLCHILILPIVDTCYPIFDIEKKFDMIVANKYKHVDDIDNSNNDDSNSSDDLTQEKWNNYIVYLNKIDKSNYDMFDIIITQKLQQINYDITIAINRASDSKSITYGMFYSKLFVLLGDSINIKYRYTTNSLFVGIFGDQGPYRKFKYYDII